jgi:amino acid transporter
MMLTILFCLGDVKSVLGTATGFPFIQIFYNGVGSIAGATAMAAVVLSLTWACAIGITTTASRMTWSFARDRGTPFSNFLMKVEPRTKVPVVAVGAVTLFACLLTLIYVGSYTAFNDVISLTITGFYGSYFLPSAFLLYHRIKGHILPHGTPAESVPAPSIITEEKGDTRTMEIEVAQARLIWGPWNVPGILGTINNAYACVYMIFVIFWSFWPPVTPVDAQTMNYSVVVTGGVIIFSIVWYHVRGKREYQGPLIDAEVATIMRMGSVVAIDSRAI